MRAAADGAAIERAEFEADDRDMGGCEFGAEGGCEGVEGGDGGGFDGVEGWGEGGDYAGG